MRHVQGLLIAPGPNCRKVSSIRSHVQGIADETDSAVSAQHPIKLPCASLLALSAKLISELAVAGGARRGTRSGLYDRNFRAGL